MARLPRKKIKRIILRELKKGKSSKELAKRFRSFSKWQIAGFKAHLTRGTYNK